MAVAETTGISFAIGILLFATTILFGWLSFEYGLNANVLKWIGLPTFAYVVTLAFNTILQYSSCNKVEMGRVAIVSLFVPVAILLFLGLTMIGLVRAPIEAAVPLQYKLQFAGLIAVAYYMFWAGLFGESIGAGFVQSCPKQ